MDTKTLLPYIEQELQRQVARLDSPRSRLFHEMLTYHMGWTGEGAGPEAAGKRIRPLLVLLCAAACESASRGAAGEVEAWQAALPAAAAVELVHNFSLVHDDIQDNSDRRRGRPTAWVKWGAPMAINVGDALFVMSNQAILDLKASYPAETVVRAAEILHTTCLELTRGQFLDMSYEERNDLTVEDYWPMIAGKTAALLSACCHIGALLGGAVLVESLFDLDGLGSQLVVSVLSSDLFTVQSFVAFIVLLVVVVNLIVDLCYALIDPRIRLARALG